MDRHVRDLQSGEGSDNTDTGGGYNTGTKRPTSSAVSWRLSGSLLVGLMLVKKCFIS